MSKYVCKLCNRAVYSQAVTFADGTLTINIPAGSYSRGCDYCLVITQAIPAETTITAPVVITIGDGTEEYPLLTSCCAPVTACGIRTRTRYTVPAQTAVVRRTHYRDNTGIFAIVYHVRRIAHDTAHITLCRDIPCIFIVCNLSSTQTPNDTAYKFRPCDYAFIFTAQNRF